MPTIRRRCKRPEREGRNSTNWPQGSKGRTVNSRKNLKSTRRKSTRMEWREATSESAHTANVSLEQEMLDKGIPHNADCILANENMDISDPEAWSDVP